MKKPKVATQKDQDMNRWCIEMAMKWPVIRVMPQYGGAGAVVGGIPYMPNTPGVDADADVIGRAGRIMAWVKASH